MTPAKRRRATPASQGPTKAAAAPEETSVADPPPKPRRPRVPDVPTAPPKRSGVRVPDVPDAPSDAPVPDELVTAPVAPAETNDGTLLGPDGEPIAQEAPAGDAGRGSAPLTETGQAAPEDRATTQSPRRSRALYAQRVWPD